MEAIDRGRKPVFVHVGINFGGADAGVTEEFLDDAKIGPAGKKMGGEGVSQKVGIDPIRKASGLGGAFDDTPKVGGGEAPAVISKEDFAA